MENHHHKKIGLVILMFVLLLVGILVGSLITRRLATPVPLRSSSPSPAAVTPIEVISPIPSQVITKPVEIKARLSTPASLSNLSATFKVGGSAGSPLQLTRQADKVVMIGNLDPAKFPKGRQTLSIYLYRSINGKSNLIGSSVFYIQI